MKLMKSRVLGVDHNRNREVGRCRAFSRSPRTVSDELAHSSRQKVSHFLLPKAGIGSGRPAVISCKPFHVYAYQANRFVKVCS